MENNKLKKLQDLLEKIKQQQSTVLVEKGILENQKEEIKLELQKLNVSPVDLDKVIREIEIEMTQKLNEIEIPTELLNGK